MFARGDKVQIRGEEPAYYVTKIDGTDVCLRAIRASRHGSRFSRIGADKVQPFSDAAKRAREAAKAKDARTCQICGRQIHAASGVIAHHGYQRPGDGWQTDSCDGARYLPFEVSRDRLGWYLTEALPVHIARAEHAVAALQVSGVVIAGGEIEWRVDGILRRDSRGRAMYRAEMIGADHCDYAYYLRIRQANAANALRDIERHRVEQQARFDGWKPAAR